VLLPAIHAASGTGCFHLCRKGVGHTRRRRGRRRGDTPPGRPGRGRLAGPSTVSWPSRRRCNWPVERCGRRPWRVRERIVVEVTCRLVVGVAGLGYQEHRFPRRPAACRPHCRPRSAPVRCLLRRVLPFQTVAAVSTPGCSCPPWCCPSAPVMVTSPVPGTAFIQSPACAFPQ